MNQPKKSLKELTAEQLTANYGQDKQDPNLSYDFLNWRLYTDMYRLLYKGGAELKMNAGRPIGIYNSPNLTFRRNRRWILWQLEAEEDQLYDMVWDRFSYTPYLTGIINTFKSWLFLSEPTIKAEKNDNLPDWAVQFLNDATGTKQPLISVCQELFTEATIGKKAGVLIGVPDVVAPDVSQLQAEQAGLGLPNISGFNCNEIQHIEKDASGNIEWVILRKEKTIRPTPFDEAKNICIYTVVDRQEWAVFELINSSDGTNQYANLLASGEHKLGVVPFVILELPDDLWIANKIGHLQLDLLNKENRLNYTALNACDPIPVLWTNNKDTSRIWGSSHLITLNAGDQTRQKEDFEWKTSPMDALRFCSERINQIKDEMYRVVHQMSLAVSSKANNVGRSAQAKIEDRRATEIILAGYGIIMRDFIEKLLNIIALRLSPGIKFSCIGFDDFAVEESLQDAVDSLAVIKQSNLDKMSKSFAKAYYNKLADTLLTGEDESIKAAIFKEIKDNIDNSDIPEQADPVMPPKIDIKEPIAE